MEVRFVEWAYFVVLVVIYCGTSVHPPRHAAVQPGQSLQQRLASNVSRSYYTAALTRYVF